MESDALQIAPMLWLIPLLPLAGFLIAGVMAVVGSRSPYGPNRGFVSLVAVAMPVLAFAATVAASFRLSGIEAPLGQNAALAHAGHEWFSLGDVAIHFGLYFDHLTSLMLLFVTGIGSLIVLYSSGYMAADRGLARFMAYLNLFLFSMIMLVLGDNLLVTFLGWEGVGLCSYLLIGFWHRDHANNDAARKAFIVNRVGDLGFLLGVFALLAAMRQVGATPSLDYHDIALAFTTDSSVLQGSALVIAATLLLFVGCTGKSAQIPLMVWLPDAMAGPTPVSALIHAATMVTAGVFLLARLADVFVCAPAVLDVIVWVSLITALWAAIAAMFQWDIKKILAYSTISQLGFMFLAAGCGRFDIALFHVFTHAFFKATLFLGAGSVIHELHHEQDVRRMGGLGKAMPVTYAAMLFAWWAIIGGPGGAGFFSKELILEEALATNPLFFGLALLAAACTAFYMTRLMVYTFWSPARWRDEHRHVHDPDWRMSLPVLILGVGSVTAGLLWMQIIHVDFFGRYLEPVLDRPQRYLQYFNATGASGAAAPVDEEHSLAHALTMAAVSTVVVVVMAVWAWRRFRSAPGADSREPVRGGAAIWTWGLDRIYDRVLVRPTLFAACAVDRWIDQGVVTPVVRGVGATVAFLGTGYRSFQRGQLRWSLALSVGCLVLVLAVVLYDLVSGGIH